MGRCANNKCGGNSTFMQVAKFGGVPVATKSIQKTSDSNAAFISIDHDAFIDWDFESGGSIQPFAIEFYFRSNLVASAGKTFITKSNAGVQEWEIKLDSTNSGQIGISTQSDTTANADAGDMWLFEKGSTPNSDPIYVTDTWVHSIIRHSDRGYAAGDMRNFDAQVDGALYTYDEAGATGNDQAGGVAISRNNNIGKSISSTGNLILIPTIEDNSGTDLDEKLYQLVLYNGLISASDMLSRYNGGTPIYPYEPGLPSYSVYKFEGNYSDAEGNLNDGVVTGSGWNFTTDTP